MRSGRLVGIIFVLIFFLFIPYYPVQLICLVLMAVVLLSYLYAFHLRSSIKVIRKEHRIATYRFQKIVMELVIENRGFLPAFSLSIIDSCGGLYANGMEKFVLAVRAREKKTVRYEMKGYRRGEYIVGPVGVIGSDPMGFFIWHDFFNIHTRVLIYPQIFQVRLEHKKGLPGGNLRSHNPFYEDVTQYRSVRDYVRGDDLRRINWKVSARFGQLFTMEYLPTLYTPIVILLNLNVSDYPSRHRYRSAERAIEIAASLAMAEINAGQEVALLSNGYIAEEDSYSNVGFGKTAGHGMVILETLARIQASIFDQESLVNLLTVFKIPFGVRIMYVGPPLSQEHVHHIASFGKGNSLVELFYLSWGRDDKVREEFTKVKKYFIPEYGDIDLEKK